MRKKLTLTIEEDLLPKVKRVAVLKRTSISKLLEDQMKLLIEENEPTFVQKWRGKFKVTPRPGDKRYEYLAKKHL